MLARRKPVGFQSHPWRSLLSPQESEGAPKEVTHVVLGACRHGRRTNTVCVSFGRILLSIAFGTRGVTVAVTVAALFSLLQDTHFIFPFFCSHKCSNSGTHQVAVAIASASTVGGLAERGGERGSPPQLPPTPRKTSKGRLVISRQSMETAFAAVCKAYVPRPGQPLSRTREEVTALAQVRVSLHG